MVDDIVSSNHPYHFLLHLGIGGMVPMPFGHFLNPFHIAHVVHMVKFIKVIWSNFDMPFEYVHLFLFHDFDLEQLVPIFSRNKESLAFWMVGHSIEHRIYIIPFCSTSHLTF